MYMYSDWASQALLRNSRYTQPYETCLCYKVCASSDSGVRHVHAHGSVVVTSTLSVVMALYTFWIPGSV
jgi:hypothetical protein